MKIKELLCVAMVFIEVSLSSCSSVEMKTVKDQNFNKEIKKVFLVEDTAPMGIHRDALHATVASQLLACGVTIASDYRSNEQADAQIQSFQPDAIMELKPSGQVTTTSKYATGITGVYFDVVVYDMPARRAVWRAQIEVQKDLYGLDSSGTRLASEIIAHLKKDRILRACPA